MIELLIFAHKSASLRQIAEIGREAESVGLRVTSVNPALGIIAGKAETAEIVDRLRALRNVGNVKEKKPR